MLTTLNFIHTLDYVSVSEEDTIPLWQQQEVKRRLRLVETGETESRSWDEAKIDIFKK